MRKPRIKVQGTPAVYHCVSRIVGGQRLIQAPEMDYLHKLIRKQSRFCGMEVTNHCLLSNHFHLVVRVPDKVVLSDKELLDKVRGLYGKDHSRYLHLLEYFEEHGKLPGDIRSSLLARMGDLSVFMQEIKQRFTRWYNRRHHRSGTLWAERFRSVLVEDHSRHLTTVALYVDLNPVRAGIVQDPKDYRYCSYSEALAGSEEARKGLLSLYPGQDWPEVSRSYREALLVQSADSGHSDKVSLDPGVIRKKLKEKGALQVGQVLRLHVRHLTDGAILGSKPFVDHQVEDFRDRFGPGRKSGARRPSALGKALEGLYVARDLKVRAVS